MVLKKIQLCEGIKINGKNIRDGDSKRQKNVTKKETNEIIVLRLGKSK